MALTMRSSIEIVLIYVLLKNNKMWERENMKTLQNKRTDNIVGRNECVLVVIDVQDKLMPAIADKESLLSNTVRLVKVCHLTGIPVVVTEQEKLGNTVAEIKNELSAETAVQKVHFNCFSCEDFAERVKKTGRKTLILAGVEAHICVTQTALHALSLYNVQIVSDAVSSRLTDNRNVALQRMRDAGATITSTEMFIYEILQKAGTDEFRFVLPLIK
jgi:nicotinamidase-related amidase